MPVDVDQERQKQTRVEQAAVEARIDGMTVGVLLLIEPQKAVVLPDDVPVGPQAEKDQKEFPGPLVPAHAQLKQAVTEQDRGGASQKPEQAPGEQLPPLLELPLVQIRAAESAEEVRSVEKHDPEKPDSDHVPAQPDVHEEEGVTAQGCPDEPRQVHPATDDPVRGERVRRDAGELRQN